VTEPELPPLYRASVANDLAEVKRLLEAGADPNDGESVYHAAEKNHREAIDLLMQYGCDISSAHSVYGNTPVFFLCGFGDDEEGRAAWHQGIAYLLERGADPNVVSTPGRETPLHRIATSPGGLATAKLLLEHGADPLIRNADGTVAYQIAFRSGNDVLARAIAERGGSVPLTPADEFIAACRRGDESRARALLDEAPAVTAELPREVGFAGTLLHWAAWTGNVAAVRTLIAVGADVNQRDREFGASPLGWAAHGSCECRNADDDYCSVVDRLRAAGATREASINRLNEKPESMATDRVAERLTRDLP
jgi:ankyrin repeat protein